jgi:Methyltransferase domain
MTINHTYLQRPCPQCFAEGLSSGIEVSTGTAVTERSFDDLASYWWGFRNKNIFFDYTRCKKCEQLYCREYFTAGQLSHLYEFMPDNSAGVDQGVLAKTQEKYIEFLYSFSPRGAVYLEIGPDLGQSASAALSLGMKKDSPIQKLIFVEPNKNVHENLLRVSQQLAPEIYGDIQQVPGGDAKVTETVMIHVLDHLVDPSSYLGTIRSLSSIDSLLLIVVHDEHCLLRRLLGRRFPPFTLQHPQLFNKKTLESFLGLNGYEVLEVKKSTNYFPIRHLASTLLTVLGLKKSLARFFPEWTVPLRLGNLIAVARLKNN